MQFDWTTFALEIINFLVLAWILQRFLYRPICAVMARRTATVQQGLAEAQRARDEAHELKVQYESRMVQFEQERVAARARLEQEIAAQRTRLLAALDASLEAEREKRRATEQQRMEELGRQVQDEALEAAGAFMSRLLQRLASAELERAICAVLVEDLARAVRGDRALLPASLAATNTTAKVASAFPLEPAERDAVGRALRDLAGHPVPCQFEQEPGLLAGLRITLGAWVVGANLRDELRLFVETARHAG